MMYADDTVIFFSAPLILKIELQLNLELINLSEWLSTNKLILNLKKTEFMVFGTLLNFTITVLLKATSTQKP